MAIAERTGRKESGLFARTRFIAFPVLAAMAGCADAQVIEIGDDGSSRIFDGPTRVVQSDEGEIQAPLAGLNSDPFEQAAATHKVDVSLLRAVAWRESRGRSDAMSSKGALGVMQLMPATAAELGVDPHDRVANISGGAAYLARQISRFGSIPLALAAYNAGPGAVTRWGGIPPYAETRAYVAEVLRRWQGKPLSPASAKAAESSFANADVMLIEVPPL